MNCTDGCISEKSCNDTYTFIITTILIGFIGFCGGQFCYIISLRRNLDEARGLDSESQNLIREIPPPYQRTDEI